MAARWENIDGSRGPITGIDWAVWLPGHSTSIDPYLVWGDHTKLAGMGGWDGRVRDELNDGRWPLLIELACDEQPLPIVGQTPSASVSPCDPVFGLIEIPGAYKIQPLVGPPTAISRFITGRVQPEALAQLLASPSIRRFELGLARLPRTRPEPRPEDATPVSGKKVQVVMGFIDDGCPYAHPAFRDPRTRGTRVRYLWDQDPDRSADDPEDWWMPADGLGYGAELRPYALDTVVGQTVSPWAPYEAADYVPVRLDLGINGSRLDTPGRLPRPARSMRTSTHGSGVMHVAAGRPLPIDPHRLRGTECDRGPDWQDAAGEMALLFVQLPSRSILDTSGGSLGVHVLDGLYYLEWRANQLGRVKSEQVPDIRTVELVVNISYGAVAGPHDGSSILERAIEDFVRRRSKTWVVTAAGNSHRSRTHAQLLLSPGCDAGHFVWRVGADNPLESYLEIWLPYSWHHDGEPFAPALLSTFRFTVQAPGDVEPCNVRMGEHWLLPDSTDRRKTPRAGVVFARKVVQGEHGTMVLLALAPTQMAVPGTRPPRSTAPHGDWVVQVHWAGASECAPAGSDKDTGVLVHAWAERNDLVYGLTRRQQSAVFSDQPAPEPTEFSPSSLRMRRERDFSGEPPWAMRPEPALGSIANVGPVQGGSNSRPWDVVSELVDDKVHEYGRVVVVGGYRLADGEMTAYSSGGPARGTHAEARAAAAVRAGVAASPGERTGPDLDAPSDVGTSLPGVRVGSMLPGSVARLSGTSAAAPRVARLIANLRHEMASTPPVPMDETARCAGWSESPSESGVARERDASGAARPTPTPTVDDLFRRGRQRVR
jgi:hypothetical protein